ncbi:hypothetical protein BN1050_00653 [Metalysinibacillus saudimassiliensis]|uniref:Helicase C-terminal domain-containing protein n=1 Tax=Metalysinibacillus saudimassiliensis TaxID=1461583 RepID=A0A078M786_9BACL|nr:hypothetical protein BN1050_00653 [Metalysinibacillus saudimassiliensis]
MSNQLKENLLNRELLIDMLKQELVGPIKIDKETMIPLSINYEKSNDIISSAKELRSNTFYYNKESNQEIISNGNTPITQYSAGMIFPHKDIEDITEQNYDESENVEKENEKDREPLFKADKDIEEIEKRNSREEGPIEYPMSDKVASSIAFTFFVGDKNKLKNLNFKINGGVYRSFGVNFKRNDGQNYSVHKRRWWARESVEFVAKNIITNPNQHIYVEEFKYNTLTLVLLINIRQIDNINNNGYFVTASLTNKSCDEEIYFKNALFQTKLQASYDNQSVFEPYPNTVMNFSSKTEEELSNELLYYDAQTYGLGHGCSVNWNEDASEIETTYLPEHEVTNLTPDIKDINGELLKISMVNLASENKIEVKNELEKIVVSYSSWIEQRKAKIKNYPIALNKIAEKHLEACQFSLARMKKGISLLENEEVFNAFKYANYAMFLQQLTGGKPQVMKEIINGNIIFDLDNNTLLNLPTIEEMKALYLSSGKGNWRAFQIAFILISLPSLTIEVTKDSNEREIVDLIWFPTGGGKTEAYLGLSAFSILYRRLRNKKDNGTDIIMRYTLRLLTADQFQRSARLICALELIRRDNKPVFGENEISIGLWVGSQNTPNKNEVAIQQYKDWKEFGDSKNEFVVNHCPLCRCEMKRYPTNKEIKGNKQWEIAGYKIGTNRRIRKNRGLTIHCPNKQCAFHEKLPLYIVDEQIYETPPTFLIGTVDKFAMLAWEPKARNIFGIDVNGKRSISPPNLIIQDELHLISGPLGSTVGIYEMLIEELCTDYRTDKVILPKIICATATVSGYKSQIQSLFAREEKNIRIFPSPGLSHKDSFFAQVDYIKHGDELKPSPGKKYLGIASNIVGIQQLQVKVNTTLLQTAANLKNPDPYWTLLAFYNSIRELGGSLTLFQTDMPNYSIQFKIKHPLIKDYRYINSIKELTSRLQNRDVTKALEDLKVSHTSDKKVVDVCLASNIIEVGVDVERLSLMTIVGQPKNTAQYIQVSGRVGRAWYERPGLVLTLYKTTMSRDKSHYEHFREYHQSLYKQVEATSVTPFSEPSIDRSLPGVIIAWIRQMLPMSAAEFPEELHKYEDELDEISKKIMSRVNRVNESEDIKIYVSKKIKEIIAHLLSDKCTLWKESKRSHNYFYMYPYGSYVSEDFKKTAYPVLTSMRNVDATCKGVITNSFTKEEEDEL